MTEDFCLENEVHDLGYFGECVFKEDIKEALKRLQKGIDIWSIGLKSKKSIKTEIILRELQNIFGKSLTEEK